MDFVSDALLDGRQLRALTVLDAFTREVLAIDVDRAFRASRWWHDVADPIGPRWAGDYTGRQ